MDDDLTSSFGNNFKLPRIEGIDDVEEKPAPKSQTSALSGALLGTSKKDYEDQAEDVLAETLDQDMREAEDKQKQMAEK